MIPSPLGIFATPGIFDICVYLHLWLKNSCWYESV